MRRVRGCVVDVLARGKVSHDLDEACVELRSKLDVTSGATLDHAEVFKYDCCRSKVSLALHVTSVLDTLQH